MWSKLRENDRMKLIYAYVISPIWIFLSVGGVINSDIYSIYGSSAASAALGYSFRMAFVIGIINYLPIVLAPTFIRFAIIQRKLKYGLEISIFLSLSLFISLLLYYFLTGDMPLTFGLFDTLSIYCILSYHSSEYSEEWHSFTLNPIVFTLASLSLMTIMSGVITEQKQWHIPIWEAVFACCVLTRHKGKTTKEESNSILELPQPTPALHRPPINHSAELIAVGLASIGRTTSLPNECLTEAKTAERRNIERPFLRQLADKYQDEAHRKVLARHFMVYKETTLFIIYALVLKGDRELHDRVRQGLKEHLLLGVSTEAQKKRNEYWHRISRKFNDEYKKHREYGTALKFSFWSTLAEEKLDWFTLGSVAEFLGNNMLHDVFMYSYKAVERKYKDLAK